MELKLSQIRARVMKYAWQIWRNTKASLSECLTKAWRIIKLMQAMRKGVVKFFYKKVDGTIRCAYGTLQFPNGATFNGKRLTKLSFKTVVYFDNEKQDFRSFRPENIL